MYGWDLSVFDWDLFYFWLGRSAKVASLEGTCATTVGLYCETSAARWHTTAIKLKMESALAPAPIITILVAVAIVALSSSSSTSRRPHHVVMPPLSGIQTLSFRHRRPLSWKDPDALELFEPDLRLPSESSSTNPAVRQSLLRFLLRVPWFTAPSSIVESRLG